MARTIGARVATIARKELGNMACGPNKVDRGDYFSSCSHHQAAEEWCADFAKWVWFQAGALHTDKLTPAAGSFGIYGRVRHSDPKVGDAVLFGYKPGDKTAFHVAIVVRVLPNGKIVSIGGNEGPSKETSQVKRDGPYSGARGSFDSLAPNGPLSGYVSPVEDDMPFTKAEITKIVKDGVAAELKARNTQQKIIDMVKKGVEAELKAPIGTSGITPAQGAKAAVHAKDALAGLAQQLAELTALVQALSAATPPAPATEPPPGTEPPTRTRTPARTGTSTRTQPPAGTQTPTRTRTPARTGTAPRRGGSPG
jgi:CHAP domain-containing protein